MREALQGRKKKERKKERKSEKRTKVHGKKKERKSEVEKDTIFPNKFRGQRVVL